MSSKLRFTTTALIAASLMLSACGQRLAKTSPPESVAVPHATTAPRATAAPTRPTKKQPATAMSTRAATRASRTTFVVPKKVTLGLASELRDGHRVALLEFEADGGAPSGCDSVGKLQFDTERTDGSMILTIRGYELTMHTGTTGGCATLYTPAENEQVLTTSWLGESADRHLSIRLRNTSNSFLIRNEDRLATLVSRVTTNVELERSPNNAPGTWDRRTLSVGMFPADVGMLWAFGSTQDQLREFCTAKDWKPVEDVYERSRQHHDAQRLFVVVRNRAIPDGADGERVGTVQTEEGRQPVVLFDTRRLDAI